MTQDLGSWCEDPSAYSVTDGYGTRLQATVPQRWQSRVCISISAGPSTASITLTKAQIMVLREALGQLAGRMEVEG